MSSREAFSSRAGSLSKSVIVRTVLVSTKFYFIEVSLRLPNCNKNDGLNQMIKFVLLSVSHKSPDSYLVWSQNVRLFTVFIYHYPLFSSIQSGRVCASETIETVCASENLVYKIIVIEIKLSTTKSSA